MDSYAPGPSEDAPNRGPAIDLMKDNPNQTGPKKQRTLFQSGMFRVEKGAQNSVVITDVHVAPEVSQQQADRRRRTSSEEEDEEESD